MTHRMGSNSFIYGLLWFYQFMSWQTWTGYKRADMGGSWVGLKIVTSSNIFTYSFLFCYTKPTRWIYWSSNSCSMAKAKKHGHGHDTRTRTQHRCPQTSFVYHKIRTQKRSIKTNMEIWIYFWYNQDRLPFNGCGVGSGEWLGMCFMQPRRGKSWPSSFWMSYQSVTAVILQRNQIYRRPMHRGMD